MKRSLLIWAVLLLVVSSKTLGQYIRNSFDKDTNFSKWVVIKGAAQADNLTDKQMKTAVDAQLATKRMTKAEAYYADLYVGYQTALGKELQFTSYDMDGSDYRSGWYGGGLTTEQTSTIYNGQLVIDMYNPKGHDLIWRGVVCKTLDSKAKPERREKNLNKALTTLLKTIHQS